MAERLQNEIVAVLVEDYGWQEVGFAIDQAAGVGILDDQLSVGGGSANPRGEKCPVNGNILPGEQPNGNLRLVAMRRRGRRNCRARL